MMLSNEGVELRVPNSYRAEYLKSEFEYTRVALDNFDEAVSYDALPRIAFWRAEIITKRKEYYEHWFRTGTLLSAKDTSV